MILQHEAVLMSARHGQFQEKEKNSNYWFEYFSFDFFDKGMELFHSNSSKT